MENINKEKNILDLRHNILLNYLNISIILIVTSFITIIIGTKESWNILSLIVAIILVVLIVIITILIFRSLFQEIKKEIRELGKANTSRYPLLKI